MEGMAEELSCRPSRRYGLRKTFIHSFTAVIDKVIIGIDVIHRLNFLLEAFNPYSRKQIRMLFYYMTVATQLPFPHAAPNKAE